MLAAASILALLLNLFCFKLNSFIFIPACLGKYYMKLYIRNMVSIRCKMLVRSELEKLNLPYKTVELGEVELEDSISEQKREELKDALLRSGLVLMEDKKSILVEKIKGLTPSHFKQLKNKRRNPLEDL